MANKLTENEKEYKKTIENQENELDKLLSCLKIQKERIDEKYINKNNILQDLEIKIKKKKELMEDLKRIQFSTISIEACSYIQNKEVICLEENLKELEDNIRCLVGMISLENSAILSIRSEHGKIDEYKKNILKNLDKEKESFFSKNNEYKRILEKMNKGIMNNKKELTKLKNQERDHLFSIEKLNEELNQRVNKLNFEKSNLNNIKSAINAIENQMIKEDEKKKIINFCWKNKREFNINNIFNDEKIIAETKEYSDCDNIEISIFKKENDELFKIKSNLTNKLEIIKQKLSKKEISLKNIDEMEIKLNEKILHFRNLNLELLQLQRELSNKEEIIQEKKKKLNSLKCLYDKMKINRENEER